MSTGQCADLRENGGQRVSTLEPYQGVLLVSFGGPESPEEVVPFLRSVTAGRGIPDERLTEVGRHYFDRGGVSPINAENRALRAALAAELARRGVGVPVFWGNRHLQPSLTSALREAADHGVRRVVAVLTSAYPSYSGCRQYREDLAAALAELPPEQRPALDKVPPYAGHHGFTATMAELTWRAMDELRRRLDLSIDRLALVFVTHSIPVAADERSGPPGPGGGHTAPDGHAYTRWHAEVARVITRHVAESAGIPEQPASAASPAEAGIRHELVFCSRSGPPGQPWLEPDISDHLRTLAAGGVAGVVVVPIGFVSDHMEVIYDLDTAAAEVAADLGLAFTRVPTVRTHPGFVAGLAQLLIDRARRARGEGQAAFGGMPGTVLPDDCVAGCCPNPRGPRPAACGQDEVDP